MKHTLETHSWIVLFYVTITYNWCLVSPEITVAPRNAVILIGNPVTLQCRTNLSKVAHWTTLSTIHDVPATIFNGDHHRVDNSQYFINSSVPGQFDLTIKQPTMNSSLIYKCTDDGGLGETVSAQLLVYAGNPLCANNIPSVLHSSSLPGYMHVVTCSFQFQSLDMKISLRWTQGNTVLKQCQLTSSGSTESEDSCVLERSANDAGVNELVCSVHVTAGVLTGKYRRMDTTIPVLQLGCRPVWSRQFIDAQHLGLTTLKITTTTTTIDFATDTSDPNSKQTVTPNDISTATSAINHNSTTDAAANYLQLKVFASVSTVVAVCLVGLFAIIALIVKRKRCSQQELAADAEKDRLKN